jgi:hypothetical protein
MKAFGLFLAPLLAALNLATPATAGPAKCLLEIGDKHYIGSVCEFTRIDDKGSFRIAEASRQGIEAEVTVTSEGKGVATWTDPRERGPKQSLGEVRQVGGCWSDAGSSETYICAWALDQDIYLGPIRRRGTFVAYGERWGMDDEIESATGLDTSHAVIHTKPSVRAAVYNCSGQADYSKNCVADVYRARAKSEQRTITADCLRKEWTGLWGGSRFRLLGPSDSVDGSRFIESDGFSARWAILWVASNSLIDNCGACSYAEIHDWYEKLCPRTAPHEW